MQNPDVVEILLVEDNDNDAELTVRALQKNQLTNHIMRFCDGQELIDYLDPSIHTSQKVSSSNSKLILLDLKLPLVSGLEVLKIIKSNPLTKSIPIVVLTSSTEDQDIAECYALGVNSYIVKPVEFENFSESIQKLGMYWLLLNRFPK